MAATFLRFARERNREETINYEKVNIYEALMEKTGGRGPDACIDAVGMEAHGPIALREVIMACRNGGTVSVPGVYGGFVDKIPFGSLMNRALTVKTGQMHVQRYMKPLL
jgi:threonine dehydrogenase-like Zn-dependent dehydrogenase